MPMEPGHDAAEEIYKDIAGKIESGELQAGRRLPTEREYSLLYGTSRAVVRRGLDSLEKSGFIVRHVGRGTFVADRTEVRPAKGELSEVSPAELVVARLVLEPAIAESAAIHATMEDLRVVQECLKKSDRARDDVEYEMWDRKLHAAIAAAAHNQFLTYITSAIGEVRQTPGWMRATVATGVPSHRESHSGDHHAVVEALLLRDPVLAKERMRLHIQKVMHFMMGNVS